LFALAAGLAVAVEPEFEAGDALAAGLDIGFAVEPEFEAGLEVVVVVEAGLEVVVVVEAGLEVVVVVELVDVVFVVFAGLLAAALFAGALSQAIPIAPSAKTADKTKVFFILIKFSCLLQRLIIFT